MTRGHHLVRRSFIRAVVFGLLAASFATTAAPAPAHAKDLRKLFKGKPDAWKSRREARSRAVARDVYQKRRTLRETDQKNGLQRSYQGRLSADFLGRVAKARIWFDGGAGVGAAQAQAALERADLTAVSLTLSKGVKPTARNHKIIPRSLAEFHRSGEWRRYAGKVDLITDVAGVFTYSDPVETVLIYGELARKNGGIIELSLPYSTAYYSDPGSVQEASIRDWLSQARGMEFVDLATSAAGTPVAILRRTSGKIAVPDLKVRSRIDHDDRPPERSYDISDRLVSLDAP